MSVVRCPACGRVVSGDTCFACGYEMGSPLPSDDLAAPSAPTAALPTAPPPPAPPPVVSSPSNPTALAAGSVRCPECGRVADGKACMACGYTWPAAAPKPPEQPAVPDAPLDLDLSARRGPRERSGSFSASHSASSWEAPKAIPEDTVEMLEQRASLSRHPLRALWEGPAAYVGVAAMSFLVVVVAGAALFAPPSDPISRIDRGEAAAVLLAFERQGDLSPTDWLARGHAQVALGQTDEAVTSYKEALRGKASDARALSNLLAALDDPMAESVVGLLKEWPDAAADERLIAASADPKRALRHNAVRVLQQRGKLTQDVEERFALLDLTTGKTCDERRVGLMIIDRVGKSDAALHAVEDLDLGPTNACLSGEHARVLRNIKQRR